MKLNFNETSASLAADRRATAQFSGCAERKGRIAWSAVRPSPVPVTCEAK